MNNEEKILNVLEQLVAGQAKLEAGQSNLEARLVTLEAGQVNLEAQLVILEAGQANLEAQLVTLEAGQLNLQSELETFKASQKDDINSLAGMIADIHEIMGKHHKETNDKLDILTKKVNAIKQVTTRNIYDIAELQLQTGVC